ncbi:MAG: CRISPR-associated protein Cas5, partial [Myxococcota bacterium]
MKTLWLHLEAEFAAFRWMQAGVYRATSLVIPPSAAWGLVLNLAHVETRGDTSGVTTLIRPDAPPLRLAVGLTRQPEVAKLYQQLHSYPVGKTSAQYSEGARGAKYHVAPVRREVLCGFEAMVGAQSHDSALLDRVRDGLHGAFNAERYGLPFAGDNNLMFDQITLLDEPP